MPNTELGKFLLGDELVVPLTSSISSPCSNNASAKGCTGFFTESTLALDFKSLATRLTSPTGNPLLGKYFLSAGEASTFVVLATAGII